MVVLFWILQEELKKTQHQAARVVTGNWQLESLMKKTRDSRLIVRKVQLVYQYMTLFLQLGTVKTTTLYNSRSPVLELIYTKAASFP